MADNWHRWRDNDGAWIEARHWSLRWDVSVETTLPRVREDRLAHAVRQDLWRSLRDLRGFRPVVKVQTGGDGVRLTVGGQIDCTYPKAKTTARIAELLENPSIRDRWVRWSGPA